MVCSFIVVNNIRFEASGFISVLLNSITLVLFPISDDDISKFDVVLLISNKVDSISGFDKLEFITHEVFSFSQIPQFEVQSWHAFSLLSF